VTGDAIGKASSPLGLFAIVGSIPHTLPTACVRYRSLAFLFASPVDVFASRLPHLSNGRRFRPRSDGTFTPPVVSVSGVLRRNWSGAGDGEKVMIASSTLATIIFVVVVAAFLGSCIRNIFHAGHDPRRHDPHIDY
jgi:hypothetical protein